MCLSIYLTSICVSSIYISITSVTLLSSIFILYKPIYNFLSFETVFWHWMRDRQEILVTDKYKHTLHVLRCIRNSRGALFRKKKSNSVFIHTHTHICTHYICIKEICSENLLLALCSFWSSALGFMFWRWKKIFYEIYKEYFFSFFFLDVKSTIWVKYWLRKERLEQGKQQESRLKGPKE